MERGGIWGSAPGFGPVTGGGPYGPQTSTR